MGEYTSGPWEIEYDNSDHSGGGQWYNVGPAEIHYPYMSSEGVEATALADANLIASAPELLEALEHARRFLDTYGYDVTDIDSVLAKAKGEA